MSTPFRYIGRSTASLESFIRASGRLVYGSDMRLPNMLHAALLLSAIPHGIVTSIDSAEAETLPGVIRVFSAFNSPSTAYSRYRLMPGQGSCPEDETLFSSHVRFVGDRVAAVAPRVEEIAREALDLLRVEYEELPALLTPADALARSHVRLHPGGNLLHHYEFEFGEELVADPQWVTLTSSMKTQRIHHAAMEPHVCLAAYDSSEGLTVWTPSQGVFGARTVIADLLDLSYNKVRVTKVPTGGSFGSKQEFILEPVTAYMAMQIGRPVRLALSRRECMMATPCRPATTSTVRTVVSREGRLLDVEVDTVFDAGAYATSSIDNAEAMAHKLTRLYRLSHYRHRGDVVYTNTPVAGGARGWGAPEIMTAAEVHLDLVARQLGMDPVELRLANLVHPHDVDPPPTCRSAMPACGSVWNVGRKPSAGRPGMVTLCQKASFVEEWVSLAERTRTARRAASSWITAR